MSDMVETNSVATTGSEPEKVTMKDINKAWLRFHYSVEIPHSFDRYIAASFLWALRPILQKIYKDEEQLRQAYERHLVFYNTQVVWGGGTILGIVASMEEERAREEHETGESVITDESINNLKAGLMGALAGIGDSIDEGVVQYIFIAIGLPWAQRGSAFGAFFPFLCFALYQFGFGWYLTRLGYKLGRQAAASLVGSSKTQQILDGLAILGLFMMGILAGSYVKISSSLKINLGNKNFFVLQDALDQLLPGILPIAAVFLLYFYFKKKEFNITRAIVYMTIALGLLAFIGIL